MFRVLATFPKPLLGCVDGDAVGVGCTILFHCDLVIASPDSTFRVPFVDFGNVGTSSTPDFTDLRMGAGVGIRYVTPFGPLRLDVGVPINRRKGEDSWAIYAGIGQAF